MDQATFSHVSNTPGYMHIVVKKIQRHFNYDLRDKKVLDIPAGNGWIGKELSKYGMEVKSADINEDKPHYVQVDMEKTLPFSDEEFDAIICCEGIEHIFSPFQLFSEFSRTLKKEGMLIITTPNIQNLFSRWKFINCGYLYQFEPFDKNTLKANLLGDKGHISPVSYVQFRYYSENFGMKVQTPSGDRMKRVILLPFMLPFLLIGFWWSYQDWKKTSYEKHKKEIIYHLFNPRVLLSRSLIFSAIKLN